MCTCGLWPMQPCRLGYAFFASAFDTDRLAHLGKTLILVPSKLLALTERSIMTELFKRFADFITAESTPAVTPALGVAQDLMERAVADANRNPSEAQNLRGAARAFLSVIR